jgi:lysozyme
LNGAWLFTRETDMVIPGCNGVIDISHYQRTPSLQALQDAGIVAVIAKATQGSDIRDPTYFEKKSVLKNAGIKWGSYHYSSGSDPALQVQNYLDYAQPEPDELIALDYEPSSFGPNMSYDQMVGFVELIYNRLGRYPVIYGGSLLRESLQNIDQSILSNCALWYARYDYYPIGVPKIWNSWTLWQYSDGSLPESLPENLKSIPGFGTCDRDTYNGTQQQLQQNWPF